MHSILCNERVKNKIQFGNSVNALKITSHMWLFYCKNLWGVPRKILLKSTQLKWIYGQNKLTWIFQAISFDSTVGKTVVDFVITYEYMRIYVRIRAFLFSLYAFNAFPVSIAKGNIKIQYPNSKCISPLPHALLKGNGMKKVLIIHKKKSTWSYCYTRKVWINF